MGAQVRHVVPLLSQIPGDIAFHLESGVIGPNRKAHRFPFFVSGGPA
jgi:hypothetical protein